jgi:Glycosyl hydrolase family 79 C-terminal beta domain
MLLHVRPRRGRRLVATAIAVTAMIAVLVAAIVVVIGATARVLGRSGRDGSRPVPVTIESAAIGPPLPNGFLGVSVEYPAVVEYAGSDPGALDPVFEQLVRNVSPGQAPVFRIGGDSADWTWWPVSGLERPPGVRFTITNRWLEVTRALADALDAHLILGVNLEADNPELTSAEANALVGAIGRGRIRALELGNEPDLYSDFTWYRTPSGREVTGRAPGYDMAAFTRDFTRLAAVLPPVPLAGPSLGGTRWTRQLGDFLTSERRVGLVTLHRYPLQLCFTPHGSSRYPTVAHLLSPSASTGLADGFAPSAALAARRGLPLRIDELNTVSCGADAAVSNTFASALWGLDTMFEMDRIGVHGVNIHTFPGAGYELFKVTHASGRWQAAVAPEYYGLLMFTRAAPPRSRLLRVAPAGTGAVKIWATRGPDGTIRVVLINDGNTRGTVALRVAHGTGTASLERLAAPSVRSASGVTLAGQSFGRLTSTGLLAGRPQHLTVEARGGAYLVRVPAVSAAMLVVRPSAAHG